MDSDDLLKLVRAIPGVMEARILHGRQRFSHQDPGFVDVVVNKKASIVRVYFPPDANCLLSVSDHCLRSRNYINVIVAGKQPALQYLDMELGRPSCRDKV